MNGRLIRWPSTIRPSGSPGWFGSVTLAKVCQPDGGDRHRI
jgi:hypothetical protein